MKKTFPLKEKNHKPERTVEAIKHEIKTYLKRETRKELPKDAGSWGFDCKIGDSAESATEVHVSKIKEWIDKVFKAAASQVYIEILSKPAKKKS